MRPSAGVSQLWGGKWRPGVFHSYGKGRDARSHEGELVAVFLGNHGWFWRNRSREVVIITLRTDGAYRELKRLD